MTPRSFPSASEPSPPYATWHEDALVRALRENDERAFAELYRRYWYELFTTALRKLAVREVAEEIVQDIFTGLWHKRAEQRIEQVGPYLRVAVKYRVIDYVKAEQTRRRYLTVSQGGLSERDQSTEERLAADDLTYALVASMEHLPEHTREVFRLSRTEHRSVPEIAERLQVSRKTVEYHLTKAIKMLRVSLKDFLVLFIVWLS